MPKIDAPLLAFNRGEVSKIALGRIDTETLRLAAQAQVNWLPFTIGPMMLRPGLGYIGGTRGDAAGQLIDFSFATDDSALIEATDGKLRIWIDDALLARGAVATAVSDPNFAGGGTWSTDDTTDGCSATIGSGVLTLTASARGGLARASQAITIASGDQGKEHGLRIVVSNGPVTVRAGSAMGLADYLAQTVLDTGTHSLALTPAGASLNLQIDSTDVRAKTLTGGSVEAAGTVELPAPWAAADLDSLRWTRFGDNVYLAAYGKQQYKIERRGVRPGARGWSIVSYRSDNGPFPEAASTSANLTPSVFEGNGALSSDQPYFTEDHIGALFRLFSTGQTNQTVLGGTNAFTDPVRVVGVGSASRDYSWTVAGTYVGVLVFQRSFDGPDSGFATIATKASGFTGTIASSTGGSGGSPDLDNAICWERVGFEPDSTVFGAVSATVHSGGTGYTVADTLALASGSGSAATFSVATVNGEGVVTGVTLAGGGAYSGAPNNPVSTSGGTGSGCKLDVTWETGSNYTSGSATVRSNYAGGGRYGICRVTRYGSPTVVNIEVLESFASLRPTQAWQEAEWSDFQGWPSAPAIQEGRLWWLGTRIWGSQPGGFTGFAEQDAQGQSLGDAAAILEDFGEGPLDRINWGLPLTRLLCGREGSIASIRSSSFDEVVTPTNFSVKDCSEQGAARLPALKAGKRGIYVQGRRIYELLFDAQSLDYGTRDLTRLNIDIGKPGFTDTAMAFQPDKIALLPRSEGQLACLLYEPGDEVEAWFRLMTLGVVERARVLPSPAGQEDRVYAIVKRTVDGASKRFIEKLALRDDCAGGVRNHLLDCYVTYSGTPVTSITAAQLPNTTLHVWADGAYIGSGITDGSGVLSPLPDNQAHAEIAAGLTGAQVSYDGDATTQLTGLSAYEGLPCEVFADQQPSGRMRHAGTFTVSGAKVALPNGWRACTIVAFFGYMAPFMSAKLAYAVRPGSAPLNKKKEIAAVGLVLYDAHPSGLQAGQSFDDLRPLPDVEDEGDVDADTIWSEYDEPAVEVSGQWNTDARLCLLGQAPYPCKVGGAVVVLAGK